MFFIHKSQIHNALHKYGIILLCAECLLCQPANTHGFYGYRDSDVHVWSPFSFFLFDLSQT